VRVTPLAPTTALVQTQEVVPGGEASAVFLAALPTPLVRRHAFGFVCPFQQPFFVPFELIVHAGDVAILVNRVSFGFVDSFGVAQPPITFAAPDLTARFPTIRVPARGSRPFPFTFEFGCFTGPTGTLTIMAEAADDGGRALPRTLRLPVS
jgi:hypothetical protein